MSFFTDRNSLNEAAAANDQGRLHHKNISGLVDRFKKKFLINENGDSNVKTNMDIPPSIEKFKQSMSQHGLLKTQEDKSTVQKIAITYRPAFDNMRFFFGGSNVDGSLKGISVPNEEMADSMRDMGYVEILFKHLPPDPRTLPTPFNQGSSPSP